MHTPTLRILGTRGVPAAHGGFETFAEHLALYLVRHGWKVIVYCQQLGRGGVYEDQWEGVHRVHIPVNRTGPVSTVIFDWKATRHAAKHRDLCLTLGYNTAVFCALLRIKGIPNVINMDGVEWSRAKWSPPERFWLWANERLGCRIGNHLVADHPRIQDHLAHQVDRSKISVIAYGADAVSAASTEALTALGLSPGGYLTLIARPEPENTILEIVRGYSEKPRGVKLVVLGDYLASNAYHRAVRAAASDEVVFPGAIYAKPVVQALRFHSLAYVHGHQVGGTNPSLVEALGCGNGVLAHDNAFNRWVVDDGALYFSDQASFCRQLERLLAPGFDRAALAAAARRRYEAAFSWDFILSEYAALLARWVPAEAHTPPLYK